MYIPVFFSLNVFYFNDTATTEIYTLSLHDALPIFRSAALEGSPNQIVRRLSFVDDNNLVLQRRAQDRKSTRLNSSHQIISYAVFCLKKKMIVFIESAA